MCGSAFSWSAALIFPKYIPHRKSRVTAIRNKLDEACYHDGNWLVGLDNVHVVRAMRCSQPFLCSWKGSEHGWHNKSSTWFP